MTTETEAEQAVWTIPRGYDWRYSWSAPVPDGDTSEWDTESLVVMLRNGSNETDTLIASSRQEDVEAIDEDAYQASDGALDEEDDGYAAALAEWLAANAVALIDTTGSDLESDPKVIALHIDDTDTETVPFVPSSNYFIEAKAEIDGDESRIMRRRVTVEGRVAL